MMTPSLLDRDDLGGFRHEFTCKLRVWLTVAAAAILAVVLLGLLIYILLIQAGNPEASIWLVLGVGSLLLASSIGAIVAAVLSSKRIGQRLLIYESGFVLALRGSEAVWRWDDIETVQLYSQGYLGGAPDEASTWLTLKAKAGGAEVCLHEFRDMPEAVAICLAETRKRLLPGVLESVGRGEQIDFGAISISASGLKYHGRAASWQELTPPRILYGGLFIKYRDSEENYIVESIARIPNFHLLLDLCQNFISA
jgi:hypothetical protein